MSTSTRRTSATAPVAPVPDRPHARDHGFQAAHALPLRAHRRTLGAADLSSS
ncbi:hypothetical protein [Streptomyces spinosirectus]